MPTITVVPLADDIDFDGLRKRLYEYWKAKGLRELAADLAQEGATKALIKLGAWEKERGRIEGFLFTIGKNAGTDLLRKEGTQRRGKVLIQREAHHLLDFKMGENFYRKPSRSE